MGDIMNFVTEEEWRDRERQRNLFTPENQALIKKIYNIFKYCSDVEPLLRAAERFSRAQKELREATANADWTYNNPRKRWHLVKAFQRKHDAEMEVLNAFEAFLTECQKIQADLDAAKEGSKGNSSDQLAAELNATMELKQ
jgi:hypothetical protein